MSLTPAQEEAIRARGNVLVIAGAGTGKTRTLVERCLRCLLDERPRVSLDEILMVTFTEAAAAEMRQRIRARLEEQWKKDPKDSHWQEQLALFETAHIGTLHSFCLQLVRQHFYELELDPQVAVMAEEESRLLCEETLTMVLQKHYAGRTGLSEAVQQLIQTQGRGGEKPIRALVLRLHHYTQTLPDPDGWLRGQLEMFAAPEPGQWRDWLLQAFEDWVVRWLPTLEQLAPANALAAECATALRGLKGAGSAPMEAAGALARIEEVCRSCPQGKKGDWRKPLEDFREEARFLWSLANVTPQVDPLAEDWNWIRSQMATLLQLTRQFGQAFGETKRELGMVDFQDLEQYALRLLWDPKERQPTKVALQWRQKLQFVFVDEYQDINAAQDKIIEMLSRAGHEANRFLVGDVKQSIYRFRLANPRIFQNYAETWRDRTGQTIPLLDNFRSREGLLNFVNSVFALLMRREIGGVPYDERAQLRFGAPVDRSALGATAGAGPCVELHLRVKSAAGAEANDDEGLAEVLDLEEADKEARVVGLRLRELVAQHHPVWDEAANAFRPVKWSDMAILLRSPARKVESYAKEFARLEIPLLVERGGFYESVEISDLLSLLQVLDNPLQDLPVLAVLHSPLVGLTLKELATIRLTVKAHYWTALLRWHEARTDNPDLQTEGSKAEGAEQTQGGCGTQQETYRKVSTFLERFARWRRLARQVSLSRCLEAVLAETHYASWLVTQSRGEQRQANVQRLLGLAQQFDRFQRQSLFRFLQFVEAQQLAETEPDVAPVSQADSVRLMSIHQSKGLEFPVVAVADLGKPFNLSDLRAEVILDEQYGLCPRIKPPRTGKRYPSLPYWLARQRQHRETLGEELRLLYVAMTRARDTLLLSGSLAQTKFARLWEKDNGMSADVLMSARSYVDWLGGWFAQCSGPTESTATQGENSFVRWFIHDEMRLLAPMAAAAATEAGDEGIPSADSTTWQQLQDRLAWTYGFSGATRLPAKTSVTMLRRKAAELMDEELTFPSAFPNPPSKFDSAVPGLGEETSQPGKDRSKGATAAEVGNANHAFLQFASLECGGSVKDLRREAERLVREGKLRAEQGELLDFEGLGAFWNSEVGRKVRVHAPFVQRELAFTARFSPKALATVTGLPVEPNLDREFVVVQGVADLAVIMPKEIWLLDFKTDAVAPDGLAVKVKHYEPQLKLYASALARIYGRPVTAGWLCFLTCQREVGVQIESGR